MKPSILNYTREELSRFLEEQQQPAYRLQQILQGLYQNQWPQFEQFSTLPKEFRQLLDDNFVLRSFTLTDTHISEIDKTTKFLWELPDGLRIESVIIYEGKRVTYCISSQVGCPLDCKFCATGKMGILRNLTAGEIIEQVLQMNSRSEAPLTNIVFMGMGEPLLNLDEVLPAAHEFIAADGFGLGKNRITISTAGIIPGIKQLADQAEPFKLALSLNAVSQESREKIMPVTRKYPLSDLLDSVREYTAKTKKTVTFEYVLMDGLNSSEADARGLVRLAHPFKAKINIIPCNTDDPLYHPPSEQDIQKFEWIVNGKRTITRRRRKGWEIQAACGQLYAENLTKTARAAKPHNNKPIMDRKKP
jgi:23S rRNA (adenine2503-C2)-methyltransferase